MISTAFAASTNDRVGLLNFGIPHHGDGNSSSSIHNSLSASGPDQKLQAEFRPDVVFKRLFGSLISSPGKPTAEQRDALASQRILDLLRSDVSKVKQQIPASERPKLGGEL